MLDGFIPRFFYHLPRGVHFPILAQGGFRLQLFGLRGGVSVASFFGREAPENGAEGAVLENFCVFSLKNAFLDQL